MRVVVLGSGFGGLELAARLSETFTASGDAFEVTLVDRSSGFVFGCQSYADHRFHDDDPRGGNEQVVGVPAGLPEAVDDSFASKLRSAVRRRAARIDERKDQR